MIYTVTFNPSVDYIMKLDDFKESELNRTSLTEKYPGGKGINVSRVLKELGAETTALGFTGGFTGDYIKSELEQRDIIHDFIEVSGDTRINVKLKTSQESEINADGPRISDDNFKALEEKLSRLKPEDHVIFAGSVPGGHKDAYKRLAAKLYENAIPFSIDSEGEKLTSTLPFKPYLVKPNLFELEQITGKSLKSSEDIRNAADSLLESGAQNVLITLGGDGAMFVNADYALKLTPPEGELVNSVGAGDSTVAGFISQHGKGIPEQVKHAVAAGSATAYNSDLATRQDIIELLDKVTIEKI
ncbi:MAG TPA: 1-phosphofructokinase [Candidatus Salinicoccus merdavium]|nr:1-phosphofructokinase [Candidatus Salinicoccus merdavium]